MKESIASAWLTPVYITKKEYYMQKGKKLTAVIMALVIMVTLGDVFAAGSSEQASAEKPEVITYWYPWGGDSETWDLWRIGVFEETYPDIKVNAVYVPEDGGLANGKLLAAIAGNNAPDVVISNNAALSYSYAAQGALEPLDEALAKAGFKESDLLAAFSSIMKYKGTTYLFPHDSNVNLLYYNTDLFREAGLDPDKPPVSIEELDAYAEKLTKISPSGQIVQMGMVPWLDAGDDSFIWGYMFGGKFYDASTNTLTLDTEPLRATYNWMRSYAKKYNPERIQAFSKGFGGAFSPDHPFFNGKVAMTVNGNWFTNALRLYAPQVNYKVAAIPAPPTGRQNASTFGTNVFLVPKGTKHLDAVVKFMLFASKPEISADNINTWRSLSAWKEETPAVKWYENGDSIYKLELEIANNPESGHPALTSVSTELSDNLRLLRDNVIYNDVDPSPLLKELQTRLQKELDKK